MKSPVEETKEFIAGAFEKLSEEVKHMLENHKVLPANISVPYSKNGKQIRLSLDISAVRSVDEDEV